MRPMAVPYYPGTAKRYAGFEQAYPNAEKIVSKIPTGPPHPKFGAPLPALFIEISSESVEKAADTEQSEYAFVTEPFAPVSRNWMKLCVY